MRQPGTEKQVAREIDRNRDEQSPADLISLETRLGGFNPVKKCLYLLFWFLIAPLNCGKLQSVVCLPIHSTGYAHTMPVEAAKRGSSG